VLADEPTANLDSVTASHLMNLFSRLNHHHHITFIIATHDKRVMGYAKRLIKMQDGKIIGDEAQSPMEDVDGE
ncbi:MAG: ABC transporter ATP-binding protein, partial [Gammaproteobacteria bacterium]|nr:ABC transporter ATP-binding protein [Gammaproteobacteria bacterium]